jgi:glycosyltransferase involved in cell wall biosynthesis
VHADNAQKLTICHFLAPAPTGGLECVVQTLAEGLARRGHRLHIGAVLDRSAPSPSFLEDLSQVGVAVHRLEVAGRSYMREVRLVRQLCAQIRPDVVHTHGYRSDLIDAWAARRASVPLISTLHGFTHSDWKNDIYQRLQRHVTRWFDAVVAVSRPIADQLERTGTPLTKISVIPNAFPGYGALLERPAARSLLGIRDGCFRIGWVGRVTRDKALDVLVDGLAGLADMEWRLSVIGEGPEVDAARQRAQSCGIGPRIDWHGTVQNAGNLMRAFDAFVLSSRTEGTPIVLFEAMAAEVPVIATQVGGVPDVVSDVEAILVRAEDPPALAAAIRQVMTHTDAAAARVDAALHRLRDFDVERWLDRYEELYRGICKLPE